MSKPKKFIVKSIGRKSGVVHDHITIVDEEDAHLLRNSFWTVQNSPNPGEGEDRKYVIRKTTRGHEYLHHIVVGAPMSEKVTHINGNPLDNRKANLLRRTERVVEVE